MLTKCLFDVKAVPSDRYHIEDDITVPTRCLIAGILVGIKVVGGAKQGEIGRSYTCDINGSSKEWLSVAPKL